MAKGEFPVYDICKLSEYKEEDIQVQRFAPYLQVHKNLHLAHRHNFYHLVLFTKGGGFHTIDFQNFDVSFMQIYFMVPGQVHSWSFEGEVDGYVINFSVPFFQSFLLRADYLEQFPFFSGTVDEQVIELPNELHAPIISLMEQLIKEQEERRPLGQDMIKALLLQLFIYTGRISGHTQNSQLSGYNYTLLRSFQKLIEQHYKTLRLPKDYAELLYVTPNHLNALCNDLLGASAGEVIRNRVVLEAKRMLVNPELSIAEIAWQLNFTDNSYFSKFFKKLTGNTPEIFRKNLIHQHHGNIKN
ncbi:helix-turn-helix transcriptional regulator [Mucilaginibacter koreensis]